MQFAISAIDAAVTATTDAHRCGCCCLLHPTLSQHFRFKQIITMHAEWMPDFFESSFLIVLTDFIAINICTNKWFEYIFKCARNRIHHSALQWDINRWNQSPKSHLITLMWFDAHFMRLKRNMKSGLQIKKKFVYEFSLAEMPSVHVQSHFMAFFVC